jgi:isopenicillin-N epimerase
LPAKEICSLARSKGVLTLVDGAQSLGYLDVNLREIGCDFYTSSTHKWLMGPLENGVLYINQPRIDKVWPNTIGAGWHDNATTVDEKLCVLGQRNETTVAALPKVAEFHSTIGKSTIERRVKTLIAHLKQELVATPGITVVTPMASEMSGGVLVIQLANKDSKDVAQQLYSKHQIAVASTVGVRLSPHVYNTLADANRVVAAIREIAKG